MNQTRAVFFFSEDASEETRPLMLQPVLFCPLLTWMSETLIERGTRRFFVACDDAWRDEALACFPEGADVTVSASREELMAFLSEEGDVAVFPCAMVPLALPGGESYAYAASAQALRRGWSDDAAPAIEGAEKLAGWTAVYDLPRLQKLELACRDAIVEEHRRRGVRILDGSAVYIDPRVEIGAGTLILPGTILREKTVIGQNCEIGPNTMLRRCTVGDGTEVNASQANESTIGSRTHVGPFAYIRPNCVIGDDIKVGDFVEVKNSTIGNGTKISHLTYVGDSDVGEKVNFGCGTVTTNYDGFKKHRCTIGDRAFLGCNTNLIAPVTVGDGAYTAAGSTITDEVPADALAVARARQKNIDGWAERRRRMNGQK